MDCISECLQVIRHESEKPCKIDVHFTLEIMKPLALPTAMQALMLLVVCTSSFAHDDLAGREKEFRYGYQVGYITAVRESTEGTAMCTKDVPLLEVIQAIGAYNKARGTAPEAALSVKNVTEALSAKYRCQKK